MFAAVGWERAVTRGTANLFVNGGAGGCAFMSEVRWTALAWQLGSIPVLAPSESEEFFRLTGQLAQPNQDYVFSKRAAFFNGLKNKVGHIMARASARAQT